MQDSYGNYQADMGDHPANVAPTIGSGGLSSDGVPTADATALAPGTTCWDYTNKIMYNVDIVAGVHTWIQLI